MCTTCGYLPHSIYHQIMTVYQLSRVTVTSLFIQNPATFVLLMLLQKPRDLILRCYDGTRNQEQKREQSHKNLKVFAWFSPCFNEWRTTMKNNVGIHYQKMTKTQNVWLLQKYSSNIRTAEKTQYIWYQPD